MNFLITTMVFLSVFSFAGPHDKVGSQWAYYGEDFYKSFNSRRVNKDQIFGIMNANHEHRSGKLDQIGNCHSGCYRQESIGYTGARHVLFGEIQIEKDSRGTFVTDVYCHKKFYYRHLGEVGGMHTEVNIEHTWPQSKFNGRFDKTLQKSDMHHLYLTDSDANNKRGNHEFGKAGNRVDELNVDKCASSKLFEESGAMHFEPPVEHRGNVARSLFYFATRYDMVISPEQEAALREWHKSDPVDAEERERHEIVVKHQKIRNPFVDHPELVDQISNF